MKTQMRVQKILMLVSLVVSALVFVYALFFMTGGLADVYRFIEGDKDYIHCAEFVSTSQSFVSTLVVLGIVMIVLVAVMYLMACHSRRKYYITNYIAIGLYVAFTLAVAIYLVVMVATVMNLYQHGILWKSGEGAPIAWTIKNPNGNVPPYITNMVPSNYADQAEYFPSYKLDPNQTYNFILGFILFVILIANIVCVTLCTVWKVLLMKGENKLLATGATANENVEKENTPAEEVSAATVDEAALGENPVKEEK